MSLEYLKDLLKNLDIKELKEVRKLVNKYYKKKKEEIASERLVSTYTNKYGIYFRLEKVFCNKENCSKCQGDKQEGHGPYWYSYKNGKREYIGKCDQEKLDKINPFGNLEQKKENKRAAYKL